MSSMKRSYDLGAKILDSFAKLPKDIVAHYERHSEQIPDAFARGFIIPEARSAESTPILSVVATTRLGPVASKKTSECFIDHHWSRDRDFDNWIGTSQHATKACVIVAFCDLDPIYEEGSTLAEVTAKLLGVKESTRLLIERGHTVTLPQIEKLVKHTELGKNTGLHASGWDNFFFVETGDSEESILVCNVSCNGRNWRAVLFHFRDDIGYYVESRLLLRNLDATKLRT